MGKLIDPERRERARQQRIERKKKILEVARTTFSKLPFVEVSLDSIGQAADVDRGVASMYFRTKEELFLLLLREELAEWYSALEAELDGADGRLSQLELAELLAGSLSKRPELTRFLSFEVLVLEQNLDAMEVYRYQRWRRDRMMAIGTIFEESVDGLEEGMGVRLLHRAQLLVAVLGPTADPKGAATYDVGDPDFEIFAIDFETEMRAFIEAILQAWAEVRG
jgi:AcrR family transcriptional regulator